MTSRMNGNPMKDKIKKSKTGNITINLESDSAATFSESLSSISKAVSEMGKELAKTIIAENEESFSRVSESFEGLGKEIFSHIAQAWEPQFAELMVAVKEFSEAVEAYTVGDIASILEKADLWITPSMYKIIDRIQAIKEADDTKLEAIEQIFLDYFAEDDYRLLDEMINSWSESPYFTKRIKIIKDAIDAHKNGKYTLSIPTLLPQIEGILSDFTGEPAGHPTPMFKNAFESQYPEVLKTVSKDILVGLATSKFLYGGINSQDFTSEKFVAWLASNENGSLNRHAILHGVHINYSSEINSLRVFMLLDSLFFLISSSSAHNQ